MALALYPAAMPIPSKHQPRRQRLPHERPKSGADDPAAPKKVQRLIDSPDYRAADRDLDFLQRPDMRGVRLMLDYLKPQTLLHEHDVAHTIVVFGGTRIVEPAEARRRLAAAHDALAARPGDAEAGRLLTAAERVMAKSRFYDIAREFGRLVGICGEKAIGGRVMTMTGGGPGIMEAANRGAHDAGAKSIGLNITLPHEQYPNPYISPDLCFSFHYFAMRKLHFLLRARALVAFPGGYGTLDELFEVLTLVQTRKMAPVPGDPGWRGVLAACVRCRFPGRGRHDRPGRSRTVLVCGKRARDLARRSLLV